uniref:Nucleotide modification associated domain-containing protein n=1 Tax=Candidatus Kentrum sp. FW TaxID=2126338 RepID=A0A450SHB0_9GAMM|nr:MAG: hypothetical protein BECKFW1821B_GA0114236_101243 [Candidatus Kentron sp. FW]
MERRVYHVTSDVIAVVEVVALKLFSYVVARDYGFAPNPFFGVCTLATCKPRIRKAAIIGDWVVGTGSSERGRRGFLVYVMHVDETMTFNEYWSNDRFLRKRPNLQGSKKQAFGDNIYYRGGDGQWHQAESHHSYPGRPNPYNIRNDTQTDRVLIGTKFTYWGGSGPEIPQRFRDYNGIDICAGRNHKSEILPEVLVTEFIAWFRSLEQTGYQGKPLDWVRTP